MPSEPKSTAPSFAPRRQFSAAVLVWSLAAAMTIVVTVLATWPAAADGTTSSSPSMRPRDPGPRGGHPGAGGPLPGLGETEIAFFNAALAQFVTIDSVTGSVPGESGSGLGPRFNANVCSACHVFPAVGGSSPRDNPLVALATLHGARNVLPSFITPDGPVREARFLRKRDGSPDGQVHTLFTITGRSDAPGCVLQQPDFAREVAQGNVALRIPTAVFGLGLVENVPEAGLIAADAGHTAAKAAFGILGHFNRSANDGTITRFGWKAQVKSLLEFSGEAYNVEQGVSNELFPNEREGDPGCKLTNHPEDATFFENTINSGSEASDLSSAAVNFAGFMRLSAPPAPAPFTRSALRGRQVFRAVGCEACHFETHTTTTSIYSNQSEVTFHPYSDFEVHSMGDALADGITQGGAGGDQFRTAPLWGVGQRLFFLHDGRTTDLLAAVLAHKGRGSEANRVIARFKAMPFSFVQDLLNFLRAL
jgi:CxxC motif-containing protein (DUF1111 family)